MISSLSRFFSVPEKKLLTLKDAKKSRADRKEKQDREVKKKADRGSGAGLVRLIRYFGLKPDFDRQ